MATSENTVSTPNADKLDFKRILPIFVIVLVDLLGLTIIIPLLPLYATTYGADPFTIGLLGTAYPLMQLVGAPLLGGLSDRYGRKPVLIVSQIGTFIGFLLLGFATSLPILFLSRIIDGLSGANIVSAQAAIADVTTERTRAQGLGLIGAAFGLGFTLGPAIAGISLAVSGNNYQVPALIAAGFSFISILLTTFWFKETLSTEHHNTHAHKTMSLNIVTRIMRALANPAIGILLILMFAQQMIFGGFEQLLPLFTLTRLGLNGAGNAVIFVFVGVVLVLVQGKYIGPWSRHFGERKLIYVGLLMLAVGLTLTALTPNQPVPWYSKQEMLSELQGGDNSATREGVLEIEVPLPEDDSTSWLGLAWIMVAMIPASIGGGILSPSINSLITKRVGSLETGSTLGVSSSLVSAANVLTPTLGGALFQFSGSTVPFLLGGGVMFVLALIAMARVVPGTEDIAKPAPATAA